MLRTTASGTLPKIQGLPVLHSLLYALSIPKVKFFYSKKMNITSELFKNSSWSSCNSFVISSIFRTYTLLENDATIKTEPLVLEKHGPARSFFCHQPGKSCWLLQLGQRYILYRVRFIRNNQRETLRNLHDEVTIVVRELIVTSNVLDKTVNCG